MKDINIFDRLFAHSGFDSKIIRYFPYDGGGMVPGLEKSHGKDSELEYSFFHNLIFEPF